VTEGVVLKLLAIGALVICSAVFTGAEAAYFSLGRTRLKRLAGAEAGEARRAPLIERPHDLLVTLLVGITFINIGGAALAASVAEQLFGARWGLVAETIGMILVLTTLGEVLPMTVAVKHPERFLAVARWPVGWLERLLTPVRVGLAGLSALTVRLIGRDRAAQPELTEEDCLDVETPAAELLPALREHLHTRVPVFEGTIDDIIGIL
jgi:Mg2+/Co2+ transporter CorB